VTLVGRNRPRLESIKVEWKETDLLCRGLVSGLASGYDAVLHMAIVSKSKYRQEIEVAESLAEEAIAQGVGHFFYTSSIRVYGSAYGTLDESAPARPCDDYGLLKVRTEESLQRKCSETGTQLRILRLGHVVSATSRVPIPSRVSLGYLLLWGRACPHYIHAREVAGAIIFLLDTRNSLKHRVYNITRELESKRTYRELYATYLPVWGKLACALFAMPGPLVYRLYRKRPEARESRFARILEKNLSDEGWVYQGRPLEDLIAGGTLT
jgi:nucleoside-diphosphate-sugar epimerase